jgi:hypothetical protein
MKFRQQGTATIYSNTNLGVYLLVDEDQSSCMCSHLYQNAITDLEWLELQIDHPLAKVNALQIIIHLQHLSDPCPMY